MEREFLAQFVRDDGHVQVRLQVELLLLEAESRKYNEVDLKLRVISPVGHTFYARSLFSRRDLLSAAKEITALAEGKSEIAHVWDYDYGFDLTIRRHPTDEARATVRGEFSHSTEYAAISPEFRGLITSDPEAHRDVVLECLELAMDDLLALAALFREFITQQGRALPRTPPYD